MSTPSYFSWCGYICLRLASPHIQQKGKWLNLLAILVAHHPVYSIWVCSGHNHGIHQAVIQPRCCTAMQARHLKYSLGTSTWVLHCHARKSFHGIKSTSAI